MGVLTDQELASCAANGDAAAFGQLYERYKSPTIRFAYNYMKCRSLAEDVVQDALLSAYLKIGQFSPKRGSFRAWLFGIVHNQCRQEVRRRRWPQWNATGTEKLDETGEIPSRYRSNSLTSVDVWEAVQCLPEKHRSAVILTKVQGLSVEECAQALGISQNNVKQRVFRGLLTLRNILKGGASPKGA